MIYEHLLRTEHFELKNILYEHTLIIYDQNIEGETSKIAMILTEIPEMTMVKIEIPRIATLP